MTIYLPKSIGDRITDHKKFRHAHVLSTGNRRYLIKLTNDDLIDLNDYRFPDYLNNSGRKVAFIVCNHYYAINRVGVHYSPIQCVDMSALAISTVGIKQFLKSNWPNLGVRPNQKKVIDLFSIGIVEELNIRKFFDIIDQELNKLKTPLTKKRAGS